MKRENWNTREKRREAERNTNQLGELLKILNHFFPDLRIQLLNVKDPRKKNYTTYETDVILLERILAYIFGVSSMHEITARFNTERRYSKSFFRRATTKRNRKNKRQYGKKIIKNEMF